MCTLCITLCQETSQTICSGWPPCRALKDEHEKFLFALILFLFNTFCSHANQLSNLLVGLKTDGRVCQPVVRGPDHILHVSWYGIPSQVKCVIGARAVLNVWLCSAKKSLQRVVFASRDTGDICSKANHVPSIQLPNFHDRSDSCFQVGGISLDHFFHSEVCRPNPVHGHKLGAGRTGLWIHPQGVTMACPCCPPSPAV